MANSTYTRFKSGATKLLKKMGTSVTVTSREGGTLKGYGVLAESDTAAPTPDATNTKTIYFQGSDKDPAPSPGDLVTIKNENWGIVSVEDINPDGSLTIVFVLKVAR